MFTLQQQWVMDLPTLSTAVCRLRLLETGAAETVHTANTRSASVKPTIKHDQKADQLLFVWQR